MDKVSNFQILTLSLFSDHAQLKLDIKLSYQKPQSTTIDKNNLVKISRKNRYKWKNDTGDKVKKYMNEGRLRKLELDILNSPNVDSSVQAITQFFEIASNNCMNNCKANARNKKSRNCKKIFL